VTSCAEFTVNINIRCPHNERSAKGKKKNIKDACDHSFFQQYTVGDGAHTRGANLAKIFSRFFFVDDKVDERFGCQFGKKKTFDCRSEDFCAHRESAVAESRWKDCEKWRVMVTRKHGGDAGLMFNVMF
jgi:hypothetical protein